MKKEEGRKKDKNQVVWEEFVYKNRIKKKSITSSVSFRYEKNKDSFAVEDLISRPKTVLLSEPFEVKKYFTKDNISLTAPKIGINIEKNKLKRIKKGKITIEGTLDLHGFSIKEAKNRLRLFIGDSLRLKKRFLLIITGKGSNSKPNIHGNTLTIKGEIKNWLSDSFYDDKVQYISKALDQHGGDGAYYFFLKKSKNIFS